MTTSHFNRDKAGFTLIEILIALFILSIGILGVTGMFITAIKANQLARTTTVGTRLAQNLMEQALTSTSTVFGNFTSGTGIHSAPTTVLTASPVTRTRGGIFRESSSGNLNMVNYSAILQQIEDVPAAGLGTWTVRVKWRDSYGKHETTLTTYQ